VILFLFCYIAILSQVAGVYFTWDDDILTYITVHKIFFSVIVVLATWSHVKASFTNPGRISHENNLNTLEYYITSHKAYIEKAEDLNIQFRQQFALLRKTMPPESDSDNSEIDSGDEDVEYSQSTTISDAQIEQINKEHKSKFERCKRCFVVRPPQAHHCSKCQSCIMKMDHHCPWINNCVGIFNQKYFILFCYYCLIGCSHATYLTSYYIVYLHSKQFLDSALFITIYVIQVLMALIFIIFNIFMLKDQWSAVFDDVTLLDRKQGRFLEARSVGEVLIEVFGESFSPWWFLPCRGNRKKMKKKK